MAVLVSRYVGLVQVHPGDRRVNSLGPATGCVGDDPAAMAGGVRDWTRYTWEGSREGGFVVVAENGARYGFTYDHTWAEPTGLMYIGRVGDMIAEAPAVTPRPSWMRSILRWRLAR
jgi:hypothetical protein